MKSFYAVAISIFFAASVIQMAAAIKCGDGCAACWKDNNNDGEDTKFSCTGEDGVHCGDVCPPGYHGIHCANIERCICGTLQSCHKFGPCQCGSTRSNGYSLCRPLGADGNCPICC
ncbi:hypothetical protein K443DRAFT_459179 [Laccaria amethystina LaAM-08-1]|uniref:EGF-like domain-containing protein n=1 Tax=Laccaria amethystina LaAM-08-1 TaxID=1095629 RepID=A0A0C9X349_9AGAR|nr:hypothetical protein K443DRAFT_459179 [Laccaria amethystina LaAM-08-1]